jgi:aspartate/methionine/tyrosine aminotransferase
VSSTLSAISGLRYHLPGGAFYFFLDVRGIASSSADWCERLLVEAGVALVPGEAFRAPGFARLTFSADPSVLSKGLEQIASFIKEEARS